MPNTTILSQAKLEGGIAAVVVIIGAVNYVNLDKASDTYQISRIRLINEVTRKSFIKEGHLSSYRYQETSMVPVRWTTFTFIMSEHTQTRLDK